MASTIIALFALLLLFTGIRADNECDFDIVTHSDQQKADNPLPIASDSEAAAAAATASIAAAIAEEEAAEELRLQQWKACFRRCAKITNQGITLVSGSGFIVKSGVGRCKAKCNREHPR